MAIVNWDGTKVAGPYVVTVKNMFEDELTKIETPENSIRIDLSDPKISSENAIFVEVSSKTDAKQVSQPYLIKKLSVADQEKIKKLLGEISTEVQEQNALNKLILAGFYEGNNLFIDAIAAYEDAVKLAPDVPTYKEAYDEFLLRQGLKK